MKFTEEKDEVKVGQAMDLEYDKLYHMAFNGLTAILQTYQYPKLKNTILDQIAALQQELEEYYLSCQ